MALSQNTILYITLVCSALILATILLLTLTTNYTAFIVVFSLYMIGSYAFLYAFLLMKKTNLTGDVKYDVSKYISLFNMIMAFFVFVIVIVLMVNRARTRGALDGMGRGNGLGSRNMF